MTSLALAGCGGGSSTSADASAPASVATPAPAATPAPVGLLGLQATWLPNTDADLVGYYLYHGTTAGVYDDKIWVGDQTSYDMNVAGPGSHYLALSAVDASGNESPLSQETQVVF